MAAFRLMLPLLLLGLTEIIATNNPTSAVTYFSEETNETNSIGVTTAEPKPHWTTTSREPDHLNFTAKETDHQKTENSTGAFKTNGAVRAKRGVPESLKKVITNVLKEAIKTGVVAILKNKP